MPSVRSSDPAEQPKVAATMKPKTYMHTGDKARVDRVPASRPVGLRVEGVSQQSHDEEEGGDADVDHDQGDHEPAPLAQLHESWWRSWRRWVSAIPDGHGAASGTVARGAAAARCGRRHSGAPSRLVTCRNHDFERRLDLLEPVHRDATFTRTRLISAMTSRGRPGRQADAEAQTTRLRCGPRCGWHR